MGDKKTDDVTSHVENGMTDKNRADDAASLVESIRSNGKLADDKLAAGCVSLAEYRRMEDVLANDVLADDKLTDDTLADDATLHDRHGRTNRNQSDGQKHAVTLADLIVGCRDKELQVNSDVAHIPAADRGHTHHDVSGEPSRTGTADKVDVSTKPGHRTDPRKIARRSGAKTRADGQCSAAKSSDRTMGSDGGSAVQGSRRMTHNNSSTSRDWTGRNDVSSAAHSGSTAYRRRTNTKYSRTSAIIKYILDEDVDAEESLQQRLRLRSRNRRRRRYDNTRSLEGLIYIKQQETAGIPRASVSRQVVDNDDSTSGNDHVTKSPGGGDDATNGCNVTNHHGNEYFVQIDQTENINMTSSTPIRPDVTKENICTNKTNGIDHTDKKVESDLDGNDTSAMTQTNDIAHAPNVASLVTGNAERSEPVDIVIKDGSTTLVLVGYKGKADGVDAKLEQQTRDHRQNNNCSRVNNFGSQLTSDTRVDGSFPNEKNKSCTNDLADNRCQNDDTDKYQTGVEINNTRSCRLSGNIDIKNKESCGSQCLKCNNDKVINTEPGELIKVGNCIHIDEPRGNMIHSDAVIKDAHISDPSRNDSSIVVNPSKIANLNINQSNIERNTSFTIAKKQNNRKRCETSLTQCNDSGIGSDSEKEVGYIHVDDIATPTNNAQQVAPLLGKLSTTGTCMGNTDSSSPNDTCGEHDNAENINNIANFKEQKENKEPRHITVYQTVPASALQSERSTIRIYRRHKIVLEEYRRHIRKLKSENNSVRVSKNVSELDTSANHEESGTAVEMPGMSGGQTGSTDHTERTSVQRITEDHRVNAIVASESISNEDMFSNDSVTVDRAVADCMKTTRGSNTPGLKNNDINGSSKKRTSRREDKIVHSRSPIASTSMDETASYKTTTTVNSTTSSKKNVSAARLFLLMTKLHETNEEEKSSQQEYLELIERTRRELKGEWNTPPPEHDDVPDTTSGKGKNQKPHERDVDRVTGEELELVHNGHVERTNGLDNQTLELEKMNSDDQCNSAENSGTNTIYGNDCPAMVKKKITKKIDNTWSFHHPAYQQIKSGFKSNVVIPNCRRIKKELHNLVVNKFDYGNLSAENVYLQEAKRIYPKGFKRNTYNKVHASSVRFANSDSALDDFNPHGSINRQSTHFTKYTNRSPDKVRKESAQIANGTDQSRGTRLPRFIGHDKVILSKDTNTVNEYQMYMQNRAKFTSIDSTRTLKQTHIPIAQHVGSESKKHLHIPRSTSDNGEGKVNNRSDKNNNNTSITEGRRDIGTRHNNKTSLNRFPEQKGTAAIKTPVGSKASSTTGDIGMDKAVDIMKSRKQFYHEYVHDTNATSSSGSRICDHVYGNQPHPHCTHMLFVTPPMSEHILECGTRETNIFNFYFSLNGKHGLAAD